MPQPKALAAVLAARKVLSDARATGELPAADKRTAALELLIASGTAERFQKGDYDPTHDRWLGFDRRKLVGDLVDWSGPQTSLATKPTIRAIWELLSADDRYSYGVELVSFASAVSALCDNADRFMKLIAACAQHSTQVAYAPVTNAIVLTERLSTLIGHYPLAVRLRILESLWETAHSGLWWDTVDGQAAPAVRRARYTDEQVAELEALLDSAAGGNRKAAVECFERHYEIGRAEINLFDKLSDVADLFDTMSPGERSKVFHAQRDHPRHPIAEVLFAHLGGLQPRERPQSPITALVTALADACTQMLDESETCDREGITTIPQLLPERPDTWQDLWTNIELAGALPVPGNVRQAFHSQVLPGTGDGTVNPTAQVKLICTERALRENADYMGNCTWSVYGGRCKAGQMVIGRIEVDDTSTVYNFALERGAGDWAIGEVNSRFNQGNVPGWVRPGLARLLARVG